MLLFWAEDRIGIGMTSRQCCRSAVLRWGRGGRSNYCQPEVRYQRVPPSPRITPDLTTLQLTSWLKFFLARPLQGTARLHFTGKIKLSTFFWRRLETCNKEANNSVITFFHPFYKELILPHRAGQIDKQQSLWEK